MSKFEIVQDAPVTISVDGCAFLSSFTGTMKALDDGHYKRGAGNYLSPDKRTMIVVSGSDPELLRIFDENGYLISETQCTKEGYIFKSIPGTTKSIPEAILVPEEKKNT